MPEPGRFLEEKFQLANWTFTRPQHGHQKECYIAQAGDLKLFVKFEVPAIEALERLGEIGVAPRVLARGESEGRNFVVQEYLPAPNPEPAWLANNLGQLAAFIRRYHQDEQLVDLLTTAEVTPNSQPVAKDLARLEARFTPLKAGGKLNSTEIEESFEKLKVAGARLKTDSLVPVHAEPNIQNMLLQGDRLFMIDWDEIRLGDRMQDIGLILWWYVTPRRWPEFFDNYGLQMEQAILDRIFWWTAKASLTIAFWQLEHGYDGQAFLVDFQAAVNGQPNPHVRF
jgi:aminoglycoside phosphotransferase (APT) family kinase protein